MKAATNAAMSIGFWPPSARVRTTRAGGGMGLHPIRVQAGVGPPKLDGIEVAKELHGRDDVGILMLTARDSLDDRVVGLDTGADDYLVKPFERQELLARLRALLRRRPRAGPRRSSSVT